MSAIQEKFIKFVSDISMKDIVDGIVCIECPVYIPIKDEFRTYIKEMLKTSYIEDEGIFVGIEYWTSDNSFSVFITDNNDSVSIVDFLTFDTKNKIIAAFSEYLKTEIKDADFY